MTHRVYFFAEQAYLGFVKEALENPIADFEKSRERGAVCIIAIACALEASVNLMLKTRCSRTKIRNLSFKEKIETLSSLGNKQIDWSVKPFNHVSDLIGLRNTLVHFKEEDIGLINTDGDWIEDEKNSLPDFDPDKLLSPEKIEQSYESVCRTIIMLAEGIGEEERFNHMVTEDFHAYLVR